MDQQIKINTMEKTLGEKRVRTDFNVERDGLVDQIKKKSAELIDLVESVKPTDGSMISSEEHRLIALAQTSYEEAAMWAVKAVTFRN